MTILIGGLIYLAAAAGFYAYLIATAEMMPEEFAEAEWKMEQARFAPAEHLESRMEMSQAGSAI